MSGSGATGMRSPLLKNPETGMPDSRPVWFRRAESLPPAAKKPEGPVAVVRRAGGAGVGPLAALATLAFALLASRLLAAAPASVGWVKAALATAEFARPGLKPVLAG